MNPTQVQPQQQQTPEVEPTPADALRGAAGYLTRYGLHQGDMFAPIVGDPFPPACIQGAVKVAICGQAYATLTRSQGILFDRAMRVLVGYLEVRYDLPPVASGDDPTDPAAIAAAWNDQPGRICRHVVTALERAADGWETAHRILAAYDAATGNPTSGGA